jgi:hypothetical protein
VNFWPYLATPISLGSLNRNRASRARSSRHRAGGLGLCSLSASRGPPGAHRERRRNPACRQHRFPYSAGRTFTLQR